jgi:UDP-N-acetylmuramoyl-L-alanyl-D-glutamate--2,6-diaminopimelate ligase
MMAAESVHDGVVLAELLQAFAGDQVVPDLAVSGLADDSRQVQPGALFLACRGLHVHGLAHAAQAVANGAVAVLWEPTGDRSLQAVADALAVPALPVAGLAHKLGPIADRFYARPSGQMQVIGVTGTDGKTSVTHFIAQALGGGDQACGLLGTLGYGVYGRLQPPTHTTPGALRLQAELASLRDAGVRQVAMEVSSHALHQHRTDGTHFTTAVLTHLSRDHLDYHGSVEAYAEAKRRLFLTPGLACAVLNVGDEFGRRLATRLDPRVEVIAYGRAGEHSERAAARWIELESVTARPQGITLEINSSYGRAHLTASLLGDFNADNLAAALGALLASGLSLNDAVRRLQTVTTVPGRMELFAQPGMPTVVVDYAHTPHALQAVLQALRPHCRGELVCVFGAGGERDTGKRPEMGRAAEQYADRVVLTSDNPRAEQPGQIIEQIAAGFEQPQRAQRMEDRGQAIDAAIDAAAPDDLVLVAGKGAEDYQQVGDRRVPFSDRARVRQALRRRAG